MTLKETIASDMKVSFKAGDTATRGTLGLLLSVIQNREIEKRSRTGTSDLTDEETVSAISTEIKKRKEAATQYQAAGRADSAANELAEIDVLMRYMPAQISEEEVKKLIAQAIAGGAKDMGRVMGAIAGSIKGKFEGARASTLVKEALG